MNNVDETHYIWKNLLHRKEVEDYAFDLFKRSNRLNNYIGDTFYLEIYVSDAHTFYVTESLCNFYLIPKITDHKILPLILGIHFLSIHYLRDETTCHFVFPGILRTSAAAS